MAVLRFLCSGLFPDELALPVALTGIGATHHEVVHRSEDWLKRLKAVDLSDLQLVDALFQLVLGTPSVTGPERRSPCNNAVRVKALLYAPPAPLVAAPCCLARIFPANCVTVVTRSYCSKSPVAPGRLPGAVKAMFEACFTKASTPRLQLAGVQFGAQIFRIAEQVRGTQPYTPCCTQDHSVD